MVEIINTKLIDSINNKLKTKKTLFTNDELNSIDNIIIDPITFTGEDTELDFNEVFNLKNLVRLEIHNIVFTNELLDKFNLFNKLEELEFYNCDLNIKMISNLKIKKLLLDEVYISNIESLNNMTDLESLTMHKLKIDLSKLPIVTNVKYLNISNSCVLNIDLLSISNKLEELYINNIKINDLTFLLGISSIRLVLLNDNIIDSNKTIIDKLINNNVKVYNEFGTLVGDTFE